MANSHPEDSGSDSLTGSVSLQDVYDILSKVITIFQGTEKKILYQTL